MFTETDQPLTEMLQSNFQFRVDSMGKVIVGEMNPVDRRLEILQRRRNMFNQDTNKQSPDLISADEHSGVDDITELDDSMEDGSRTDGEGVDVSTGTDDERIEVNTNSPTDEQLEVVDTLAERYPDAEALRVEDNGWVELLHPSGGTSGYKANRTTGREIEEVESTNSKSTPTMSTAVAEKHEIVESGSLS